MSVLWSARPVVIAAAAAVGWHAGCVLLLLPDGLRCGVWHRAVCEQTLHWHCGGHGGGRRQRGICRHTGEQYTADSSVGVGLHEPLALWVLQGFQSVKRAYTAIMYDCAMKLCRVMCSWDMGSHSRQQGRMQVCHGTQALTALPSSHRKLPGQTPDQCVACSQLRSLYALLASLQFVLHATSSCSVHCMCIP